MWCADSTTSGLVVSLAGPTGHTNVLKEPTGSTKVFQLWDACTPLGTLWHLKQRRGTAFILPFLHGHSIYRLYAGFTALHPACLERTVWVVYPACNATSGEAVFCGMYYIVIRTGIMYAYMSTDDECHVHVY